MRERARCRYSLLTIACLTDILAQAQSPAEWPAYGLDAGGHGKMGTTQGDYVMAFALR